MSWGGGGSAGGFSLPKDTFECDPKRGSEGEPCFRMGPTSMLKEVNYNSVLEAALAGHCPDSLPMLAEVCADAERCLET
jgi:hypothetical protein